MLVERIFLGIEALGEGLVNDDDLFAVFVVGFRECATANDSLSECREITGADPIP